MYSTRSFRGEVGTGITDVEIPSDTTGINLRLIRPAGVAQVSSYNWIEAPTATIMVPGRFLGNLLIRRRPRKMERANTPCTYPSRLWYEIRRSKRSSLSCLSSRTAISLHLRSYTDL